MLFVSEIAADFVVRASISVRRRLANEIEIETGESALSWWVEGYPRSRSTN